MLSSLCVADVRNAVVNNEFTVNDDIVIAQYKSIPLVIHRCSSHISSDLIAGKIHTCNSIFLKCSHELILQRKLFSFSATYTKYCCTNFKIVYVSLVEYFVQ